MKEECFTYTESEGAHDWEFWRKCLEPAFEWLTAESEPYS